jgi:tetratricopeptide (TPR) repeat protein
VTAGSALARLTALRDGQPTEADLRWVTGPHGLLAACREAVRAAGGGRSDALADLDDVAASGMFDWLDDVSVARPAPRPSARAAALVAATHLATWAGDDPPTARQWLRTVVRGLGSLGGDDEVPPGLVARVALDGDLGRGLPSLADDLVEELFHELGRTAGMRPALAAAADLVSALAALSGPAPEPGDRSVAVTFLTDRHRDGQAATLVVTVRPGEPVCVPDLGAAPFTRVDHDFGRAVVDAWTAAGRPFGVRWAALSERTGRPLEVVAGASVGLAMALATAHLADPDGVPLDPGWAFTGAIGPTGDVRSLLDGGPGPDLGPYRNKLEAAGGRTVVVPALDHVLVSDLVATADLAASVLGVASLDDAVTLSQRHLRGRLTYQRILAGHPDALAAGGRGARAARPSRFPRPRSAERALPSSVAVPERFPFVGRDAELGELVGLWKATDAEAQGAFVVGDAGSGKSRLVRELARFVHESGGIVLVGHCDELVAVPYQPAVECVRQFLERADDATLAELRPDAAALARLAPDLGLLVDPGLDAAALSDHVDDGVDEGQLFGAVSRALTLAAATAPVLVVVEDLHWATRQTLVLVRHLLQAHDDLPVLFVATYRDSDVGDRHPLLEVLGDRRHLGTRLARIPLANFDLPTITAVVHETLESSPARDRTDAVAGLVFRESGGNPLFATELIQQLLDERGDDALAAAARGSARVPTTIRDVVLARIAHLSPAAGEILGAASVVGTEFGLEVLRRLVEHSDEDLLDALSDATGAHVLEDVSGTAVRFRFSHAVVRTVLYAELPTGRRVRLHQRVAEAVEQLPDAGDVGRAATLAFHFGQCAALGGADRAIRYATEAGDAASEQLGYEEAARWYGQAVELLETRPDRRAELNRALLARGRAQHRAGIRDGRATLLAVARRALADRDPATLTAAALAANRGFFSRTASVDREWTDVLEQALTLLAAGDSAARAELLAVLAAELTWADDGDRRFDLSDEALAMARRVGDAATTARVLYRRSITIMAADTVAQRHAEAEELLALVERLGDEFLTYQALDNCARVNVEIGDVPRAVALLRQANRIGQRLRQPLVSWLGTVAEAGWHHLWGALDDAERLSRRAHELGIQAGQHADAAMFHAEQMLEIRRLQGRLAEEAGWFLPLVGVRGADLAWTLTRYAYVLGRADRAALSYDRAVAERPLRIRRDVVEAVTLRNLAFLAVRFGDRATAAELVERLRPQEDTFTGTTVKQPAGHHYLGMLWASLGRPDAADAHFARAHARHLEASAPLLVADTEMEWARALWERDEPDPDGARDARALALVAAARDRAVECGAAGLLAEIAEAERRRGAGGG